VTNAKKENNNKTESALFITSQSYTFYPFQKSECSGYFFLNEKCPDNFVKALKSIGRNLI